MEDIIKILGADTDLKNLKVLATLPAKDNTIDWAIFGRIDNKNIYLIPISKLALEEAKAASTYTDKRPPNIQVSKLTIRNADSNVLWYEGTDKWKNDIVLALDQDSKLEKLNNGGWKSTTLGDISYWVSNSNVSKNDALIIFPAPKCHIINYEDSNYKEYKIWFGIRDASSQIISVDLEEQYDGSDCAIIWGSTKRMDDIVLLDKGGAFECDKFARRPLIYNSNARYKRTYYILDNINDEKQEEPDDHTAGIYDEKTHSWVIKEGNQFSIIYARAIRHNISGGVPTKVLQISRIKSTFIYTKLSEPNGLLSDGGKTISKLKSGIESTLSSNPMGVVPVFSNMHYNGIGFYFISEWECDNAANSCKPQKVYDLNETLILDSDNLVCGDDKFKLDIQLPLLKTTDSNTELKLTDVAVNTNIKIKQQSDNGTLFRFILAKYNLSKNLNIIDGAFEFEFDSGLIKDTTLPNKYGKLRFTLQDRESQTPLFIWQLKKGTKIALNYAIEDFSLPVKLVKAAGQDLINKERFLAASSLGAIVEGAGERDEPPLIIPRIQDVTVANNEKNYYLTFSESTNIGQDYRLDIKLQEVNPDAIDSSSSIKAIMVDTNPQFIGLLDARFLQQPGYDDGAWILARRSQLSIENGAWEILDDSANTEGFKLILPSQAIGEAYVKKDLKDRTPNDGEPEEGKPIQFKFGAPAILKIGNERLERRYVAPPWNLRHIWGQPGSELPGVPFLEAQFELLYGLTGHLKPENTNIAELASKLGEIPVPPANTIFWKPTRDQNNVFKLEWQNYLQFYRAWKSRLAILEPSEEKAFGNAKFTEKLKYKPRIDFKSKLERTLNSSEVAGIMSDLTNLEQTAAIKALINLAITLTGLIDNNNPSVFIKDKEFKEALLAEAKTKAIADKLALFERIGASLRNPIPVIEPIPENGEIDPKVLLDLEEKIKASHDINGLAGGFHYGFESKQIYKEFWREAFKDGSSSAELEAPAYSSAGGWGKQTARYAGDKTIIKSTTNMGRTNFYAVERIGRIGVLWHKAKHVIEYERTVVPSDYFKDQPTLLGRPIVRKVREYIEILEPIKKYPDFQGQSDDAPGSVKSCHFKSKIILVRSSWGKDVSFNVLKPKVDANNQEIKDAAGKTVYDPDPKLENFGWEIQLWHPDADPKLFPKPQIAFELIAPPDSNLESLMVNLSEPQNLRFYTDTREKVDLSETIKGVMLTADTSQWPAIKYVDYTLSSLPNENHLAPALDGNSGKGMEYGMPDILEVSPGFERFTFRVDKSELPAGVANRYNPKSGISGKMKAVTMMRMPIFKSDTNTEPPSLPTELNYVRVIFNKLADDKNSLINSIYNGELTKIKSINEVSKKVLATFDTQIDGKKLSELLNDLNLVDKDNLIHFQTLYNAHSGELQQFPPKYLWKEAVTSAEALLNRVLSTYQDHAKLFKTEIDSLIKQGGNYKDEAIGSLNRYKDKIGTVHLTIDYGLEFFATIQGQLEIGIKDVENQIAGEKTRITDFISQQESKLQVLIDANISDLQEYKDKTVQALDIIIQNSDKLIVAINKPKLPNDALNKLRNDIVVKLSNIKTNAETLKNGINGYPNIDDIKTEIQKLKDNAILTVQKWDNDLSAIINKVKASEKERFGQIKEALNKFKKAVEDAEKSIIILINNEIKTIEDGFMQGKEIVHADIEALITKIQEFIDSDKPDSIKSILGSVLYKTPSGNYDSIFDILKTLDEWITYLIKDLITPFKTNLIDKFSKFSNPAEIEKWLKSFPAYTDLQNALNNADTTQAELFKKATDLANNLNKEFGNLAGEVAQKIKEIDQATASYNEMRNSGKQVLDNYRSVWDEFTAPGMGLNRKTVSMIVNKDWKDVEQRLSITPCISRVKQFENDLEGLGMRLPVTNIFEGLLPPKPEWVISAEDYGKSLLSKFQFSDVMSDIGAMRLDKLFPSFKMPDNLRDNIKITQGFDKQNLFAWVNAEIDFKLDAPQSILAIGPIEVKLNQGKFTARVRMEMDVEGNTKKQNSGMLAGDWETNIGGIPIMTFKEAKAIFEDEKLTFDLDPSRMEMPGLLKLLTDASKNIPASGDDGSSDGKQNPFKIGLLEIDGEKINPALTGRKLPIGVKASLDLPPISVGGGTTAMTNLSFGGHFVLQFFDTEKNKFGFMTGLGFYLGKQEAPFNFTAFILGGGGFVNSNIIFKPEEGLSVTFTMSVHASVGFALTLGWMNGSILIMLGMEGEYNKTPSTESSVYVTIFVQIIGTVSIMGLVTVYLGLRLAATYTGSQLIGKGQVVLRIKICWCLTVSVNKQYEKTFVGSSSSQRQLKPAEAQSKASKISNTLS